MRHIRRLVPRQLLRFNVISYHTHMRILNSNYNLSQITNSIKKNSNIGKNKVIGFRNIIICAILFNFVIYFNSSFFILINIYRSPAISQGYC